MEKKRNTKILAVLFMGVLMGALDISIVGPAMPSIEKTIQMDHRSLAWIFSIYVLFNLIGVSPISKLSDLYGRRLLYVLSVAFFGLGSVMVSLSDNLTVLLIGRAIQGFGASGIFPVASAVIGDIFPPEKRGRALGLIGAVFGIAFILGPILAGFMLLFFKWNALFLINLPIVAVLMYYGWRLLPSHGSPHSPRFDYKGIFSLAILLSAFAYGINSIDASNFTTSIVSYSVFPFLIIALLSLMVFLYIENRAEAPVVKIKLFDIKQIRLVGIIAFSTGILQSAFVFIPAMAVSIFHVTSAKASFMLLPVVIAIAIGSPVSGRILDKVGSRIIVLTGLVLVGSGMFLLSRINGQIMLFNIAGVLIGFGLSMLLGSSLRYIMLNEVPVSDRALGQGLLSLFFSTGQMTGGALIGGIVASHINRSSGYSQALIYLSFIAFAVIIASVMLKSRRQEIAMHSLSL
jgi:EmrB/QacA subfamily drug resistance transporter